MSDAIHPGLNHRRPCAYEIVGPFLEFDLGRELLSVSWLDVHNLLECGPIGYDPSGPFYFEYAFLLEIAN